MLIFRKERWFLSEVQTLATLYFSFPEEPTEFLTSAAQDFNNLQPSLQQEQNSRGIVNDCVQCINQVLRLHCVEIHLNCSSFCYHVSNVVMLVSKHGNPNHWDPMVDGFIEPVGPTMRNKGLCQRMAWNREGEVCVTAAMGDCSHWDVSTAQRGPVHC